jgi:hypothetical protein
MVEDRMTLMEDTVHPELYKKMRCVRFVGLKCDRMITLFVFEDFEGDEYLRRQLVVPCY